MLPWTLGSAMTPKNIELLILLFAVLFVTQLPTFLFASTINADEWVKSISGVTSGGAVFAAYKLWKGQG